MVSNNGGFIEANVNSNINKARKMPDNIKFITLILLKK